jgi:uncharacterized protein (DUF302 family)
MSATVDNHGIANLWTRVDRATAVRKNRTKETGRMPVSGILQIKSKHSVAASATRCVDLLTEKGIKIFIRIDQRAEAEAVGLSLRPTELIVFGDPKTGTPLMDAYPSLALDLPLKLLIYEDAVGEVWLCFNSPEYLAERHGLTTVPFQAISQLFETAAA